MPFWNSDKFKIHYKKLGHGRSCICLVHGWGFDMGIWEKTVEAFSGEYSVLLVDLPGYGASPFNAGWTSMDEVSVVLKQLIVGQGFNDVILLGWSMGASVSARLASNWAETQTKLIALIMVGASPSYIRAPKEDFGVKKAVYRKINTDLKTRYPESFISLLPVLLGDGKTSCSNIPTQESLIHSLKLFSEEKLENVLKQVFVPSIIIHGAKDKVFNENSAYALNDMLHSSKLVFMENSGHAPFLDEPDKFHEILAEFIEKQQQKLKITSSFSNAYSRYDTEATYQKKSAKHLVTEILGILGTKISKILDVGTGTGFIPMEFAESQAKHFIVGSDISFDMLRYAAKRLNGLPVSVADGEQLSFKGASFDLVISNMMYHWVNSLEGAFAEASFVLLDGGLFAFSIVIDGTLRELKTAYEETMRHYPLSSKKNLYPFPKPEEVINAVSNSAFEIVKSFRESFEVKYSSTKEMLKSFKSLGASNPKSATKGGLVGKDFIKTLHSYYPRRMKKPDGICATYELMYVISKKSCKVR